MRILVPSLSSKTLFSFQINLLIYGFCNGIWIPVQTASVMVLKFW